MSFVGKAVKKVFKTAAKVRKKVGSIAKKAWGNKWIRLAIIVGASVFTAGLASGGFAAFSAASTAAGGGIGGFFSAVGTTMATGYASITASVSSLFGGAATTVPGGAGVFSAASQAGALAGTTGTTLAGSAVAGGVTSGALTGGVGSVLGGTALAGGGAAAAAATAGGGIASGIIGTLMSPTIGGTFARTALIGGISAYMQKKQYDDEREYKDQATVYGGPAFGGDDQLAEGFIRKPILDTGGDPNQSTARNLAIKPQDQPDPRATAQLLDPRAGGRAVTPDGRERRRVNTDMSRVPGMELLSLPKVGVLS
jgi:hypothetical protein